MKKELELRMYFLVPYNISEIQKGIQSGHAALEYARKYGGDEEFKNFVDDYKTWIILNGGTTGSARDSNNVCHGTLDQFGDFLSDIDYKFASFNEPDLNGALSALSFICDERVFNNEDYPDFETWVRNNNGQWNGIGAELVLVDHNKWLNDYIDFIGGAKIYSLKSRLRNYKLA